MDYFIKWPEAIPIPDQEASTVAEELVRAWISRYGVPMLLHSYQGTNFNSALFTELCKLLGILKTRTTALHPESDGMVERFNPPSGSVFFLKRFEKRAAAEPLSILKVSSSQQKIFPKAQQIKSLPPFELWTVSNPLGGAV
ncbi:hypothetical protein AVEN_133106-1 [Araneus ventricosus]|uniref:Integrase catalytic domain-containing protein n=1 Tax=Araneus ventricosus TaxID=182803 RepID=A0A4Y2PX30_ARAVE|nr:hypothetical protein AVEN_133106-1 [Araneus ventricosus]